MIRIWLPGLIFLILTGYGLSPKAQPFAPDAEVGIFERLDQYLPEDIVLIDHEGRQHRIYDLLDKPTILALVYYRCPGICSPFMRAIADVVNSSNLIIGKDFQILTISFDVREGVDLARSNRNNYHHLIKKDFDPEGWKFFVADSASIARLTDAVGFKFKRTGMDFVHTSAMIFVSKSGKITRYLHGTYFLPIDLRMAVIETSEDRSGPSISRLLAFCYAYDPESNRYVMSITRVAGIVIMFFALVIFIFLIIKPKSSLKTK